MDIIKNIALEFWSVLVAMSPYLLFGFLVAGIISIYLKPETIEKHLGGNKKFSPVFKAALFGVPLPLCSCGVIPVAASLRRHGASKGATTSFLLSTPQTGVDSIMVTYSLMGTVFAIFRPVAAFVTGIIGGLVVNHFDDDDRSLNKPPPKVEKCHAECCNPRKNHLSKPLEALRYGFVTLPKDIGSALLWGLLIAGAIAVFVPDDFFAEHLGSGFPAMLVMMLIGIPLYVCATASVPVAVALMLKGISPGAALVFLMTGPATNGAAITTIWKIMGKNTAIIYMLTVAVLALGSGLLLDQILTPMNYSVAHCHDEMLPNWFGNIAAVTLLLVILNTYLRKDKTEIKEVPEEKTNMVTLHIAGMTCSHCVRTVTLALQDVDGVESVDVDLKSGTAKVYGDNLDQKALKMAVEDFGYTVKEILA